MGSSATTVPAIYHSSVSNVSMFCFNMCQAPKVVSLTALYVNMCIGPFYLVSMPGEVKDPTQGVNG